MWMDGLWDESIGREEDYKAPAYEPIGVWMR